MSNSSQRAHCRSSLSVVGRTGSSSSSLSANQPSPFTQYRHSSVNGSSSSLNSEGRADEYSSASPRAAELEFIFWLVRHSEVLSKRVLRPVSGRAKSRDDQRELAFLRSLTYVCLASDKTLLARLESELSVGGSQMAAAHADIQHATLALQRLARGMRVRMQVRNAMMRKRALWSGEKMRIKSVCVFGSINMDLRAETPGTLPLAGRGVATTDVGRFTAAPGGKGANEAVSLARLGVLTHLMGRVGRDDMGRSLLRHLQTVGAGRLNLQGVRYQEGVATGVAVQVVSNADKQKLALFCAGANGCVSERDVEEASFLLSESTVNLLLLQLEVPMSSIMAIATEARERGCIVALKAAPLTADVLLHVHDLLNFPSLDLLFLNEWDAPMLIGSSEKPLVTVKQAERAAETILSRWPSLRCVVVTSTLGHVLRWRRLADRRLNEEFWFSEPEAEKDFVLVVPRRQHEVVDVIGAADSFVGGFIAGLSRGLSALQAMLWAHGAGSLTTLRPGAQEAMPTMQELSNFLQYELPGLKEKDLVDPLTIASGKVEPAALRPSNMGLLQNWLHLAALRADVKALEMKDRSEFRRMAESLIKKDATGLTPIQRAHECWKLARNSECKELLRLLMALRLLLVTTGDVAPLAEHSRKWSVPIDLETSLRDVDATGASKLDKIEESQEQMAAIADVSARASKYFDGSSRMSDLVASSRDVMLENELEALDSSGPSVSFSTSGGSALSKGSGGVQMLSAGKAKKVTISPGKGDSIRVESFVLTESMVDARVLGDGVWLFGSELPPDAFVAAAKVVLALLQTLPSDVTSAREVAIKIAEQFALPALKSHCEGSDGAFHRALLASRSPVDGATLFVAAAGAGALSLVEALLDGRSSVDSKEEDAGAANDYFNVLTHSKESALHLAAAAQNAAMCELLLSRTGLQASGNHAKDVNGCTPYDRCGLAFSEQLRDMETRLRHSFFAFISHFKAEGALHARWLKSEVEREVGQQVFLDSDNLYRIDQITKHVRESRVMLILQTRNVLTRPYCLLELLEAIRIKKPIVAVHIVGSDCDYDFEEAEEFLEHLDTRLSPQARTMLTEHGVDMGEAAYLLSNIVPKLKSLTLDTHASRRILHASVLDIVDAIQEAKPFEVSIPFKDWMASRGSFRSKAKGSFMRWVSRNGKGIISAVASKPTPAAVAVKPTADANSPFTEALSKDQAQKPAN